MFRRFLFTLDDELVLLVHRLQPRNVLVEVGIILIEVLYIKFSCIITFYFFYFYLMSILNSYFWFYRYVD
jgi:hypothetical protein